LTLVVYLSFVTQWCGNGVISYYLTLILDSVGIRSSSEQTLLNAILQLVSWIAAVTGGLLVDRVGRRRLFLASITGMLATYTAWTACSAVYVQSQSHSLAVGVLFLIFLFQVSYSCAITPLASSMSTHRLSMLSS
jgi:MFS family permease